MFYRVDSIICAGTEVQVKVVLIEKGVGYSEVVRTIHFTIAIEDGRRVYGDEVNGLVEKALGDARIDFEGPEFVSSVVPASSAPGDVPTLASAMTN